MQSSAPATPKFSVIIPAYNEAEWIATCLEETCRVLARTQHEVIVVDDGSQDQTAEIVRDFAARHPQVRLHSFPVNRGKGAALIQGSQLARGEFVVFLDADLELHPTHILAFYERLSEAGADVVIGSKHHPQSQLSYPLARRITSAGYAALMKFLLGLHVRDTQTGIKLFRSEVLQRAIPRLQIERFAFDLELLVAASRFGYQIIEAPVEVKFQRPHSGRMSWRTVWGMFWDTLKIFYWSSFWNWLNPGWRLRLWMALFVIGLVTASFGLAHWLAVYVKFPEPVEQVAVILTLRFLDTQLRDWIMMGFGSLLVILALLELNKGILAAFGRANHSSLHENRDQGASSGKPSSTDPGKRNS